MPSRGSNPEVRPRRSFRYWATSLIVVLGLLTLVSTSVGYLAADGVDPSLTIGFVLLVVGLVILLLDAFNTLHYREKRIAPESSPESRAGRGLSLFVLGASLAIGGMLYAWTGVLWVAIVALWPPIIFRPKRRP